MSKDQCLQKHFNQMKTKDQTCLGGSVKNGRYIFYVECLIGTDLLVTVKEYQEFSEWYLQTFSTGILEVLLRVLDGYRGGHWVPPRVLQQTLNYISQVLKKTHLLCILL